MKKNLLFDFNVNKENKTIYVKREFNAELPLVWDAWTTAELLDQWWAPEPYKNKTKSLDFREGGRWLYCMVSPENEVHWCVADYSKINAPKSFSYADAFSDENGNINEAFPSTKWTNTFSEKDGITTVDVVLTYDSVEALEKIIEMGFKEGFSMGLGNLDRLLASLNQKNS